MKKYLTLLLLLLIPLAVYATVDTLEGETVTTSNTIEGVSTTDTVEGQVLAASGACSAEFLHNWNGASSGSECTGSYPDAYASELDGDGDLDVVSSGLEMTHDDDNHTMCYNNETLTARDEYYVRTKFKIASTVDIGNTQTYLPVFWIRNSSSAGMHVSVGSTLGNGNINTLRMSCDNDGTTDVSYNSFSPSADTWYTIDGHFKAGTGADGICQLRVDEGSWVGDTNIDSDTITSINSLFTSYHASVGTHTTGTNTYYFDDVEMRVDSTYCYTVGDPT